MPETWFVTLTYFSGKINYIHKNHDVRSITLDVDILLLRNITCIYRAYTKEWCGIKSEFYWNRTILLCMPCIYAYRKELPWILNTVSDEVIIFPLNLCLNEAADCDKKKLLMHEKGIRVAFIMNCICKYFEGHYITHDRITLHVTSQVKTFDRD
jgi:hypothetical protein